MLKWFFSWKINLYIINLIKFNEGMDAEVGADDISPVLNYVFIKAHPYKLYTDVEFIKIFSEFNDQSGNIIANIEGMYKIIINSNPDEFKKR